MATERHGTDDQSASPRRPYTPPMLTAEGTLDELTLIPTFIVQSYSSST
jgi:hypothetical protein